MISKAPFSKPNCTCLNLGTEIDSRFSVFAFFQTLPVGVEQC